MSIKDNISFVKEELNTEEKFLESFVKVERFYKKYKSIIIGTAAVIVIAVVGTTANNYINKSNKEQANTAFNKLLANPDDAVSLVVLKEKNRKLFEVAMYLKAKKEGKATNISVDFLKELSDYDKALQDNDLDKLNQVLMKSNFLLKEYAIFSKALIQAQNKKYSDAKETLKLIPKESKIKDLVLMLEHYLITK